MEEWDKLLRDNEVWCHLNLKGVSEKDIWRLVFKKIEAKDPIPEQEKDCFKYLSIFSLRFIMFRFVKEYLNVRSNLLLDLLLEEKEISGV